MAHGDVSIRIHGETYPPHRTSPLTNVTAFRTSPASRSQVSRACFCGRRTCSWHSYSAQSPFPSAQYRFPVLARLPAGYGALSSVVR